MSDLKAQMLKTISAGLRRRSLTKCSKWAENCVIMGGSFPGPINWKHYPWLKEMHDSEAEWNIGQKSAQMGYSVMLMNRTYHLPAPSSLNLAMPFLSVRTSRPVTTFPSVSRPD